MFYFKDPFAVNSTLTFWQLYQFPPSQHKHVGPMWGPSGVWIGARLGIPYGPHIVLSVGVLRDPCGIFIMNTPDGSHMHFSCISHFTNPICAPPHTPLLPLSHWVPLFLFVPLGSIFTVPYMDQWAGIVLSYHRCVSVCWTPTKHLTVILVHWQIHSFISIRPVVHIK